MTLAARCGLVVCAALLLWSCGLPYIPGIVRHGASLVSHSDQPCADKVALAENSPQPVDGAWNCFDTSLKKIYAELGIKPSDAGLGQWLNPAKYMETIKFVGHRALYDSSPDPSRLLYRVEGHPNGRHIIGYTEIEIATSTGLVMSASTTYCQPEGDIICTDLPT